MYLKFFQEMVTFSVYTGAGDWHRASDMLNTYSTTELHTPALILVIFNKWILKAINIGFTNNRVFTWYMWLKGFTDSVYNYEKLETTIMKTTFPRDKNKTLTSW
jgi:hypothetical protein